MTLQLALSLDLPPSPRPLARRTDPPTSHVAAEHVARSGQVDRDKAAILARLKRGPATNVELRNIERYGKNLTARVSNLREDGHLIVVERGVYRLREGGR